MLLLIAAATVSGFAYIFLKEGFFKKETNYFYVRYKSGNDFIGEVKGFELEHGISISKPNRPIADCATKCLFCLTIFIELFDIFEFFP
jgi:hypothetical protein